MRFADLAVRLAALPATLPAPAEALTPTFTGPAAGRPRPVPLDRIVARPAAVLVLLFPDEAGEARVVLTERATRDGHHSAEVSFPGGRAELSDTDLAATALREAAEEVALDAAAAGVRVIGELERFWIPISNYDVTPILALAERRPNLVGSPDEVARIVEPRMADFLPGAPFEIVERTVRGWPLRYGAYQVEGLSVWGATARILSQLGAVLDAVAMDD
jgi:8-oxo-dGTP pyrophosphatase MutT (NUDIX family)